MKRNAIRALVGVGVALAFALALCATVKAESGKKGTLKVAGEGLGAEIELADKRVITVPPNGTASVPAGTYNVKSFSLLAKDKRGRVWKLKCTRPPEQLANITINEGDTATFDVGPPLFATASTFPSTREPGTIQVGLNIQGKAQEYYSPAAKMGSQEVPPPKFKIVTEDGKTLQAGQLEYG